MTEVRKNLVRSLVARCVEATERGEHDPAAAVCANDPELESAVRNRLARLERLGLIAPAGSPELDSFGSYRVERLLGTGGMGAVYLATQHEPVRRHVALKVIKLGMDSAAVMRRFELERQALAAMDHDAIAKIYDAGMTDRGQPFFSMEYVEGATITDYCDAHELSVVDRLLLFIEVCTGVQHAHQKGVVHRDLKPSNVLVRHQADGPRPKIIDFGLARATDRDGLRQSLLTELGQVVGTPEYMAPEQAEADIAQVDTRSDVYSLGVMLFEILTGNLPEGHGKRPSTVTAAPAIERALRGDLDWIVLRAMALEPDRRYASAAELAQDLKRHLDGDPVLAGPPSATYRLTKLVRRHRVLFGAAALVVTVAVASAVALYVAFARATRDADDARANLKLAVEAVDSLLVQNADSRLRGVPNANPIILDSLRDAIALYDRLLARVPGDHELRLRRAEASSKLGARLVGWRGVDCEEGRESLHTAARTLAELRRARPDDARVVRAQARLVLHEGAVLLALGDREKAIADWRRAVEDLTRDGRAPRLLADLHQHRANWALVENDFETALSSARESLQRRRALVAANPGDDVVRTELARALNQMVALHGRQRNVEAALPFSEEACALADALTASHGNDEYYRQDQVTAWALRAELERETRRLTNSERSARRALALYTALIADHPENTLHKYGACTAQLTLAKVLFANGDRESAIALVRDGLTQSALLRRHNPRNPQFTELRRWQLRALVPMLEPGTESENDAREELARLEAKR